MTNSQLVKIYTDGACSGNPGPGGWGAVLIFGENILELNEGYRLTTNNRMEILAVVMVLFLYFKVNQKSKKSRMLAMSSNLF